MVVFLSVSLLPLVGRRRAVFAELYGVFISRGVDSSRYRPIRPLSGGFGQELKNLVCAFGLNPVLIGLFAGLIGVGCPIVILWWCVVCTSGVLSLSRGLSGVVPLSVCYGCVLVGVWGSAGSAPVLYVDRTGTGK